MIFVTFSQNTATSQRHFRFISATPLFLTNADRLPSLSSNFWMRGTQPYLQCSLEAAIACLAASLHAKHLKKNKAAGLQSVSWNKVPTNCCVIRNKGTQLAAQTGRHVCAKCDRMHSFIPFCPYVSVSPLLFPFSPLLFYLEQRIKKPKMLPLKKEILWIKSCVSRLYALHLLGLRLSE